MKRKWICLFLVGILVTCLFLGVFMGCPMKCCGGEAPHQKTFYTSDHCGENESHHFCTSLLCGFGSLFLFQTGDFSPAQACAVLPFEPTSVETPSVLTDIFRPPINTNLA